MTGDGRLGGGEVEVVSLVKRDRGRRGGVGGGLSQIEKSTSG